MSAIELRCRDIQEELDAEDDLVEIGVVVGHLIGVASDVSQATAVPVPEFNKDPCPLRTPRWSMSTARAATTRSRAPA